MNENNILNGNYGWCIVCRNGANLYCKDTRYSVCSVECKQQLLNMIESIDKSKNEKIPKLFDNNEVQRHIGDAIVLFKSICKLFNKQD